MPEPSSDATRTAACLGKMSLSSLIVQREIASIREIEEALSRQVLYGGDFVTNLLEVSRIDESVLMPLVAESFGLAAAPTGELPRTPAAATRLVAADVVAQRAFAPLEVGASLVVAVAEPLSADAEQELTFALALPIEQRIAPLFRIRQALARDYGIPLDKRIARLITKVVDSAAHVPSKPPPAYDASVHRAPPRPPSIAAPPPSRADVPIRTNASIQGTFVRKTEVPPPRPPRRRRGPLTTDMAKAELDASSDRDVVFDLLFEFARQFFDYTVLFIVHGNVAEGHDAFGDGAPRDKVARINVPLELASMLGAAREAKTTLRTVPSREGVDPILFADLGREATTECVVFPIVVRKRVVALLLGDGGASRIDALGVVQVEQLLGSAASAFERVIMRRKMKGTESAEGARARARKPATDPPPPTQVSGPPSMMEHEKTSERPTREETAPPIRDLMTEPPSGPAFARAEPTTTKSVVAAAPATSRSDRPPPENLLAVRRPSGRPIPREEPMLPTPERVAVPSSPMRTRSQSMKRAEAPSFDFGVPSMPSIVTEGAREGGSGGSGGSGSPKKRDSLLTRTLLSEMSPVSEFPRAPKVESPLPDKPPAVTEALPPPASSSGGVSFGNMPFATSPFASSAHDSSPGSLDFRPQAIVPKVTIDENGPSSLPPNLSSTLVTASRPPLPPETEGSVAASRAPITPLVVVTPDREMSPVALDTVTVSEATPVSPLVTVSEEPTKATPTEPVLALSQRKGGPPVLVLPPDPRPMPMSEQQVSVPAHKPPSSRSDQSRILPSVIVDVSSEFVTLVDRVLAGHDEEAETALLRAGSYAMPAIMAKFPGPIVIEPERLESAQLPRVAECGPVIRLVASQRRTALPYVLSHVEGADVELRFWATYLLTELVYPDAIEPAIARTFDEEERVRRAARAAVRALAEAHPQPVVERLGEIANTQSFARRVLAVEALAETREPGAVPVLLPLLEEDAAQVVDATRAALVLLTQQDYGRDTDRWIGWWAENRNRHRIEWLIDALMHEQRAHRGAASDELRGITKEYFGYYDDLPKRERERAQARYREWWENVGRVRFSRAATRAP